MPKQDADRAWVNRRIESVQTDIDSHTGNTSNPHSVTATQVGKDTAQWNANKLQGVSVSASAPSSGQVLKYNGTAWAPATDDTGGGGSLTDGDKGDITVSSSGTVWTIDNSAVTNAKIATGIDATKLADGSVTNTELQYIGTLTSDAQTQLDGKLATGLAVLKADYTPAHSILVQQSGTGAPTALQIGNNTLLGRLSGGDSDIDDLSTTDVRTLLSISNVDNTSDANKPISTATQTALDAKVDENAPITGATKTKITYDAKGLVTAGSDATTADIADSSNKRYVTDAQLTVIGNTSGTNTGDQNLFSTIAVSGQSNVVADTTSDTLTIVAGSNITITTDAATDSVTIAASGGGVSDGDKGDITVSASGATWTIDNDAVTYAKIQNVTDACLLGRSAGTAGDCQEITVGSGLSLSGGALTATGSSGGVVLLDTQNAAGLSTIDFTTAGWFDGTYSKLWLEIIALKPTTDAQNMWLRGRVAGSYLTTSSYDYINNGRNTSDAAKTNSAASQSQLIPHTSDTIGNSTNEFIAGDIYIDLPNSSEWKYVSWKTGHRNTSGVGQSSDGTGWIRTTSALDGLRLLPSGGGTWASGTVRLRGILAA